MMKPTKYYQLIWCLYDWAHTVWPVLIITFVFPNYFVNNVASTPAAGNIEWANTMTISGILIALLAPIIGVISDTLRNSTLWFRVFTLLNIACAFSLWYVKPSSDFIFLAMTLTIVGTVGFEVSSALYNGYLTSVTTPKDLSKISGIGWGLGYFSGILCLTFCLFTLVLPDAPMFGLLTKDEYMHIRAIGPIVGIWYLVFSLPMLLQSEPKGQQTKLSVLQILTMSYQQFIQSIHKSKKQPYIYYFLIYRMLYTDGINTLFIFAGIYAAKTFGMSFNEIIPFAIACNLSAGIGCFLASASDSVFGERFTINISLVFLIILLTCLLLINTIVYFWIYALLATLFVGPLQTSSRSLMAKICPPESKGEFFGLYALSGRITSFLGPLFLSLVTQATGSDKLGMATILLFLLIGLIGMAQLKIPHHLLLLNRNH